jgi:hypothetical protein
LVTCIVPLESPWGLRYSGLVDNPFYSRARFLTIREVRGIIEGSGLRIMGYVATLGSGVGEYYEEPREVGEGDAGNYGFVCIRSMK